MQIDEMLPSLEIGRRVLAGELIVWRRRPALAALVTRADALLRAGLDGDPLTAEARLAPEDFIKRVRRLRAAFKTDSEINATFKTALVECGLDSADCYWDPLQLRAVPGQASHHARRILPLPAHRDNWGSNIPQQINWWSPLYPIAETRTILFYPEYFAQAVANSSADWDFEELKRLMAEGKADHYPVLPVLTEELPARAALPVVLEPGDMLAFSGQHLHGSIATDGKTRFSIESRTINLGHRDAGLAAPNVDGRAPRIVPDWFEHLTNGENLGEIWR
ncbi:hypothetical protein [Dongia sp.]|uniref:hypothetical protein n=1 Tax=Dongia sp. TaxID=1977262 RepID=UPI0035B34B04